DRNLQQPGALQVAFGVSSRICQTLRIALLSFCAATLLAACSTLEKPAKVKVAPAPEPAVIPVEKPPAPPKLDLEVERKNLLNADLDFARLSQEKGAAEAF